MKKWNTVCLITFDITILILLFLSGLAHNEELPVPQPLTSIELSNAEIPSTPPNPPENIYVVDTPNDGGTSLTIKWNKSPDESNAIDPVVEYEILRAENKDGPFVSVGSNTAGKYEFVDSTCKPDKSYFYKILAKTKKNGESQSTVTEGITPIAQWFNMTRVSMLVSLVIVVLSIGFFLFRSKKQALYIRKIAGLEAIDEAVGRATEMGRSILYIPGIMDMDDIQTIAGISILGSIAKKTAEYETGLLVPVSRSVVMTACQEIVKEAYTNVGHRDAYYPEMVRYLTDDQFGFAAGVDGILLRERPAACFYLGKFYAESLILAETGFSIQAIQIAGTAESSQLPFFVTACDYTLIGEELFAASAYLSQDAKMLGSLKGQDVAKAIILIFIILGIITESMGFHWLSNWLK
jgi:hypothetical protein